MKNILKVIAVLFIAGCSNPMTNGNFCQVAPGAVEIYQTDSVAEIRWKEQYNFAWQGCEIARTYHRR